MDTPLKSPLIQRGTIPQPVMVIGAIVVCCVVYGFASGSGSGRTLESDRLIVAECWKSLDRRASTPAHRKELADGCVRMERGFHLKHGATP